MTQFSINSIDYLNTWINTVENGGTDVNPKKYTIWEDVIVNRYSKVDNKLYIYLKKKLQHLKNNMGEDFKLALLCSVRNLARIIKQTDDLESKIKNFKKLTNNREKMQQSLNIYTSLAQGPFFDELDILTSLISILHKKDYTNKSLAPAIDFLSSKKNDFSEFAHLADSDIRNSQDHNNVSYNNYDYIFKYRIGKQSKIKTIDYSTFVNGLKKLLYGIKAFIKVFVDIISEEKINNDTLIKFIVPEKRYDWYKLLLTTHKISCEQFEIHSIMDERTQITISFNGLDVSENKRLWFLVNSAIMAYTLITNERLNFDRVFINFKSPRTLISFIVLPAEKISQYINKEISFNTLVAYVDGSLGPVNDDIAPLQDISYHDIKLGNFSIKEIEDISSENKKIFKAIIVVPNITTVKQIKVMAENAINLLKKLPNGGNPSFKTKHGSFSADRIYFVVYRSEKDNRSLFKNNSNFITTIQFDKDSFFEINSTNSLLYPLKREIQKNVEFRWNPSFIDEK